MLCQLAARRHYQGRTEHCMWMASHLVVVVLWYQLSVLVVVCMLAWEEIFPGDVCTCHSIEQEYAFVSHYAHVQAILLVKIQQGTCLYHLFLSTFVWTHQVLCCRHCQIFYPSFSHAPHNNLQEYQTLVHCWTMCETWMPVLLYFVFKRACNQRIR